MDALLCTRSAEDIGFMTPTKAELATPKVACCSALSRAVGLGKAFQHLSDAHLPIFLSVMSTLAVSRNEKSSLCFAKSERQTFS